MAHQVLQDGKGSRLDINISPIDPLVVWAKCSAKKPVPRLRHQFSPTCLRRETVATLHILVDLLPKILLDDRYFAIVLRVIFICLYPFQILHENLQRPIFRVADQKCKIDQVVRVGEVMQVREKHRQMWLGVS